MWSTEATLENNSISSSKGRCNAITLYRMAINVDYSSQNLLKVGHTFLREYTFLSGPTYREKICKLQLLKSLQSEY